MREFTCVAAAMALGYLGAVDAVSAQRDEAKTFLESTRALETAPMHADAKTWRVFALNWIETSPDATVRICRIYTDFATSRFARPHELTAQYSIGLGAFRLNNRDAKELEVQVAGMESALRSYKAMLSADKSLKPADGLDALVAKQTSGELAAYVAERCAKDIEE